MCRYVTKYKRLFKKNSSFFYVIALNSQSLILFATLFCFPPNNEASARRNVKEKVKEFYFILSKSIPTSLPYKTTKRKKKKITRLSRVKISQKMYSFLNRNVGVKVKQNNLPMAGLFLYSSQTTIIVRGQCGITIR